jgi:hypothetical integral membrane protein (TIGR02206 family)
MKFAYDYNGDPFIFFSTPHMNALYFLLGIYILIFIFRKQLRNPNIDKTVRYIIAVSLILQELSLSIWRLYHDAWNPGTSLPLHLCGASIVLSAVMMINKNYTLFEINYFWGLGGAIQALLTPNIGIYGFPHYRYFQFFTSHGLILVAVLYMVFVYKYSPQHRSIWKVMGITVLYTGFIAIFNFIFKGNYLFICWKPETGSLMDFMGPWPWYIIPLAGVAIVTFYIWYSPFAIKAIVNKVKTN